MSKRIDLTNKKYNRLLVVSFNSSHKCGSYWNCVCDCGNSTKVLSSNLRSGLVKSCGCLSSETTSNRNKTHGLSNSNIYNVYKTMISRCCNINNKSYKYYGGRGISVCDRWLIGFEYFFQDMGGTYKQGLSIDRINVNGNYSPENCKWVTFEQQSRNRTDNVFIEYNGLVKTMKDWSVFYGLSHKTVWARINRGWSIEKTFNTPVGNLKNR